MDRFLSGLVVVFTLAFVSSTSVAEEIRDYYAEPGLNPFKESVSQNFNESIDPFSGILQLKYTDVYVPGNGGMDISVNRVYTSLQTNSYPVRSLVGVGWVMHFGRIVASSRHTDKICSQGLFSVTTKDNPSIEYPDGGREILALNSIQNDGSLISRSNWKATCDGVSQGMLVTAPNGTKYKMDRYDYYQDEPSWLTTRIEDVNGNWIRIDYEQTSTGESYITEIYRSEEGNAQPVVQFQYEDVQNTVRLTSIEVNGQRWNYHYEEIPGYLQPRHQLKTVTRPDQKTWEYEYNPKIADPDPDDDVDEDGLGSFSLNQVKYPDGALINYTYQYIQFDKAQYLRTTSVHTKTVSGLDIQGGTTTYEFSPHSVTNPFATDSDLKLDETVITTPTAKYVYHHLGKDYVQPSAGYYVFIKPSDVGLLIRKITYELDGTLKEVVIKEWGQRKISDENFFHGGDRDWWVEHETNSPILLAEYISRDSYADIEANSATQIVRYRDHDLYGNPQRIEEFINLAGVPDKISTVAYQNDESLWILGLPVSETISHLGMVSSTLREYYPGTSLLKEENSNGVVTKYTYSATGDLASLEDAKGNTTEYLDYKRGIPQKEFHPESVTVAREVNDNGTVASETDGRGHTKYYTYDGLNRLSGITFPIGLPVSISYSGNERTLTRGHLTQRDHFDQLGQLLATERSDTSTLEVIRQAFEYDSLGRNIFKSHPNSINGTAYQYDALDRNTRITHADGSFIEYEYDDFYITERNEKGVPTHYQYRTIGISGRSLVRVDQPESVSTVVSRNVFEQITQVFQGQRQADGSIFGVARDYEYDSRFYLTSINDPEVGLTIIGNDELGNQISSQVGDSAVTIFEYDDLNRLKLIDYPVGTEDSHLEYDENSNLKQVTSGITMWEYIYDENNNLREEQLTVQAILPRYYNLQYQYNDLDTLEAITYPDGLQVDYSPNALGRARKVGNFADNLEFHPSGQIQSLTLGNGIPFMQTLDERLFPESIVAGSLVNLAYTYDPVGNVSTIIDAVDTSQNVYLNQGSYDNLNRLRNANGSWGAVSVEYDTRGNIASKARSGSSFNYKYANEKLALIERPGWNGNFLDYDEYGNIIGKSEYTLTGSYLSGISGKSFRYDHASHLVESRAAGSTKSYIYDGNNQRSLELVNDSYDLKFSVHSANGQLMFEESILDCTRTSYIRLGRVLLARSEDKTIDASVDSDSDSISDCLETQLGLNPNDGADADLDLDGDGLSNRLEVESGTKLSVVDTDGDGLSDGEEFSAGLSPTNSDSDYDGIDDAT